MYKKPVLVIIPLVFIILFSLLFTPVTSTSFNISNTAKQTVQTFGNRHYMAPDCLWMPNGKLLVVLGNGTMHGSDGPTEQIIGTLSGGFGSSFTWSDTSEIYDGGGQSTGAELHLAPDGYTIICNIRDDPGSQDKCRYLTSTNNASSWTDHGYVQENKFQFMHMENRDNVIYALCFGINDPSTTRGNLSFWKNTNVHGAIGSWELVSWLEDYVTSSTNLKSMGESDFTFLSDTHIIAYSYCKSITDYDTTTWLLESNDAGVTWANEVNVYDKVKDFYDPDLDWLNEEQGILMLHGRQRDDNTDPDAPVFTITNDGGETWYNTTELDTHDGSKDTGYTGFDNYDNTGGFMVWYYGLPNGQNDIFGCWVKDNTEYSSIVNISFVDINNKQNNTYTAQQGRYFNWTRDNTTSRDGVLDVAGYEINIANASTGFITPFYNETVNSSTPNYSQNDTVASFYISNIEDESAGYGNHIYRVRPKYRKVTR